MSFKIDDAVQIKYSLLDGVVKGAAIDQTTLDVQYLVTYTDNVGESQERYFVASDLEAV
jgi:hypothetical protein